MHRLKRHQLLFAIAGASVVAYILALIFVTAPAARSVRQLRENVETTRRSLSGTGWPLDHAQLQALATQKARERTAAHVRRGEVLRRTTSLFQERVVRNYETREQFRKQVTRLDYQEEFNRIASKLAMRGVVLEKTILGLSEDSTRAETYQLVLQLWTVEALTDAAAEHQLVPMMVADDGTAAGPERGVPRGSAVTVLDPRAYYLDETAAEPYLLEFPVRIRLQGRLADLHGFLLATNRADAFLAVPRMELRKAIPEDPGVDDDTVRADLECSAFFLLKGELPTPTAPQKSVPLPRGA